MRMATIAVLCMTVLAVLVGLVVVALPNEVEASEPLQVEVKAAPTEAATGTPETLYIDLAWGQKMYVRCSENPAAEIQPAGEMGMVSFGADVWGVECYPPGTNERLETGD